MVKKIQFEEEDILGFEIAGQLSEPAFIHMMQELIPKIESPGHIKLYIEVPRLEGVEWQVVWDSLKWASQQLGKYFKKVDKIAIVTDKTWLQFLASMEYALIPSITQKSFDLEDKQQALLWIKS